MKEYNLFISHSWSYNNDYLSLNNLLRQNGYFKFNNFSVPIDNPLTIIIRVIIIQNFEIK